MLLDALQEAEAWRFQEQIKAEVSNLELLRSAGVEVHSLDKSALNLAAEKIVQKYIARDPLTHKFYKSVK